MEENIKLLLVDDTPENIDILGALLKDYKRQFALNGEKALELAKKDPKPDLILLDIMMPGINGYEVCQRLKKDEETKDIPVIFLTAKTNREDILKGFEIGAQDYITKPFDSRELMARVKTQLEIIQNRKKLQDVNTWLEEQVNQRTEELQIANSELQKAKKELENLDASKSEFLKIISHEIRTPLNGIIGSLSILKELQESEETLMFIDILDTSVNRLENFSTAALDVSALKVKGENTLRREPSDVFLLINETIDALSEQISSKALKIKKQFIGDIELVNVDPGFTKKALTALLDNTIKFSPKEGEIQVNTCFSKDDVKVEFIDQGEGFNDTMLSGLAFLASGKHIDQNPGLGLYLSYLIAISHGGTLKYENMKDGGAKVCFQLKFVS